MEDQVAPKRASITMLLGMAVILALIAGLLLSLSNIARKQRMYAISTYVECKDAGYPIMETYPEQCTTPDGRVFANDAPATQMALVMIDDASSTESNFSTTSPQAI